MLIARFKRLDLSQGARPHAAQTVRMRTTLHARLVAETDKYAMTAQARVAQLQETLKSCHDGTAAQLRVLAELQATRDKISWLQTLKDFVLKQAGKPGPHERLPVALTANPTARRRLYDRAR